MKKSLTIIGKVVSWIVILALIAAIAMVIIPQFRGIRMYTIRTGSMLPTYGVGDLIYVRPTSFDDIRVDDSITYAINSQGTIVTHRVIGIDAENRAFLTQGDNNPNPDARPISYNNVIGVVAFSVPRLGLALMPLTTFHGQVAVICAILIFIILMNLISYLKRNKVSDECENYL
ncbi:MAG: signal peptidase I [Oscillospiraceae bacterium]|nr:signal peptidase I [Oscillospiraceae bacterium]